MNEGGFFAGRNYSDYGFKLKSLQTSGIAHLHEPANRIHNLG